MTNGREMDDEQSRRARRFEEMRMPSIETSPHAAIMLSNREERSRLSECLTEAECTHCKRGFRAFVGGWVRTR